jgi:hypothetical protein
MKILLILTAVLASPINVIPNARLLFGRYSGAAKCDSVYETQEWKCGSICNGTDVVNSKLIHAKIDSKIDGAVQITRNDELGLIVIAFRGTRTINNLLQDLKFWKSSPDWQSICGDTDDCDALKSDNDTQTWTDKELEKARLISLDDSTDNVLPTNIHVHAGFEGQYLRLREINPVIKQQADEYPTYQIICTGHSLGGAMAHLLAADLNDLFDFGDRLSIYSFGQPRVGDQGWAEYLATLPFGPRIYRYAIRGDPIVQLPPRVLGYRHSRSQWMVEKDGTVTSCAYKEGKFESEQCIWGVTENKLDVHQDYDFGGECDL